jgi:hypothetical protein
MTPNATAFVAANKESPVVSGSAIEQDPNKPSRGARYTLKSGRNFRLTAEECRQVGMPRWDL